MRPVTGRWAAVVMAVVLVAGCAEDTPPEATPSPTPAALSPTPLVTPSPAATPAPTPEPELTLDLPEESDPRVVDHQVTVEVPAGESGRIVVTVTNQSDSRIEEIVVRWPTELGERLFLEPAALAQGVPLVVPWTKWVEGPGERGEPAGTTSLGWGPVDAGATLDIEIIASRRGEEVEPLAFDLQVLARNAVLTGPDGEPAVSRVEVP